MTSKEEGFMDGIEDMEEEIIEEGKEEVKEGIQMDGLVEDTLVFNIQKL
jgi:hypothetical protein